jgi:Tol biopolymer transport system component
MVPPGVAAQLFAPEVFSKEVHTAPIFSPDGQEVYWGSMEPYFQLQHMRIVDGVWTRPAVPAFSRSDDSPAFSPDGDRLYFVRQEGVKEGIYFIEKTATGWSAPTALPRAVNSLDIHWQLSVADNGDLYFGGKSTSDATWDIYRAALVDGQYTAVTKLGGTVNSELMMESSPYIARDGSYLLFTRESKEGMDADLYASFPQGDGTWGEAIRFAESVNSSSQDSCPWVSDDGEYLFFISFRDGKLRPYWVDAKVLKDLRPR